MSEEVIPIPTIAMFRLITGEDIVSQYEVSFFNNTTMYNLINPTKFVHRRYNDGQIGIALTPWLPDEVLLPGEASVVVSGRDIVATIQLRPRMEEFYSQYIKQHRAMLVRNDEQLDKHLDTLIGMYEEHSKHADPPDAGFDNTDDEGNTTH